MNQATNIADLRAPSESKMPAVSAGFFNLQSFELIQRVAKAFSTSDLVPKQYQNNLPNCMIALDMAQRIGANPLMVMQNLYVVHGTPGWSSKFLIATINASGRYTSMRYEWKGEPGAADYGCRAWAIERETGDRLDGIWVTWAMVKAEGWSSKNGSKWNTMPDQMFIYRAAAFWQRAYAPEISMGLQTSEELGDIFDASPDGRGGFTVDVNELKKNEDAQGKKARAAKAAADPVQAAEAEVVSQASPTSAPDAQASSGHGPSLDDALFALKDGDVEGAKSLASGFEGADKVIFEQALANRAAAQSAEQDPPPAAQQQARRQRPQMNLE